MEEQIDEKEKLDNEFKENIKTEIFNYQNNIKIIIDDYINKNKKYNIGDLVRGYMRCFVVEEIGSSFDYYNIRSIYNEIPKPVYYGKSRRFNKETKEYDIFLFNDSDRQRSIRECDVIENRVIRNYKKD